MPVQNLQELLLFDLSSARTMEEAILANLSQMEQATQDHQLKRAFEKHLDETRAQVGRLDECIRLIGGQPMNVIAHSVSAMSQDLQAFMEHQPSPEMLNLFLLEAAFKTEYFEMATYRGLLESARAMGQSQVAELLLENLKEEEDAARTVSDTSYELLRRLAKVMKP